MLKKMMLLAVAACALVAFAAPAAQAGWTHEGLPLEGEGAVQISGSMSFSLLGGLIGWHSTFSATLTMEEGSTGTVTDFTVMECTGTGTSGLDGLPCTATKQASPWVAHVDSATDSIEITDIEVHNLYYNNEDPKHENAPEKTSLLIGDIRATPAWGTAGAISTVNLSSINATSSGFAAAVTGALGFSPAGTYGVE